jgi:predicted NBD/HSP70 family sugar kinase
MSDIAPGTPSWLRERNDRTALTLLLEHGALTRTRLGELTGLSKPTAAQMVSRLERAGLIEAVGEVSAGRGPNAISYGVRGDRLHGVAIDIRERTIAAQLVDALDREYPVVEVETRGRDRTPEGDVQFAIEAATSAAGVDPDSVAMVCIGVQAAISLDGDTLSFTDTLPGWPELGARRRIEDALGLDVLLDNDVNLAAVAERAAGAARDVASFALIWMGDGLGLAIDLGGSLHRGATGSAGEIGYLPVPRSAADLDPDAEDLTDLLGGAAVMELRGVPAGDPGGLAGAVRDLPDDDRALSALADRVALGVVPVLAVLDPELVVLGGPTGLAGGERLAELVAQRLSGPVARRITDSSRWRPAVHTSGIAGQPVLGGARRMLVGRIHDRLVADISTITP